MSNLVPKDPESNRLQQAFSYKLPPELAYQQVYGSKTHLREYWRILWKKKWIIVTVVLTVVIAATIYTFRQTPIYTAATQIELDLAAGNVLPYRDFNGEQESGNYQDYLHTQIKIIQSRSLASRVVQSTGLHRRISVPATERENTGALDSMWSWVTGLSETSPLERSGRQMSTDVRLRHAIAQFRAGLSVTPLRNSRVVEISFDSPDPELAARLVNTLANEYIDHNFEAKFDATTRATEFLQKQLVDLKAKVERSEEQMVQYARENNILNVGEKQDVILQTLSDLNAELTNARSERVKKESLHTTLADATPEDFPQALRTSLIQELEGNLVRLEQELARVSAQLGPEMPQVKQLESQVQEAQSQLRREKLIAIENARTEYETALERERLVSLALEDQKQQANQLNEASIHYNILKREVETNKQLYDGLLQRMKEAGVAAGLKSSNIRVIDAAEIPALPSSPNLVANLRLSLILGLLAGMGLAFFLNYLDNTVKTPEEVEEFTGLVSLGLIPSLESDRGRHTYSLPVSGRQRKESQALVQRSIELAPYINSRSLIAEAYRTLRTAILLSTPDNPPRRILVTSPRAKEGKTTTACNTGIILAQSGKRVLIVDSDMRRPRINQVFQQNGNAGLSAYLSGQADLSSVIRESEIPNVSIIGCGTQPPNPSELLVSQRMRQAMEELAEEFDHIILDSPPILSVSDALVIAPLVDGVILVIQGGKVSREALQKTHRNLQMVNARILGVLINNVDIYSSDYSYYYRQYYDYGSYISETDKKI